MLASYFGCNELLQVLWLKTVEMCFFTVLEAKVQN